MDVKKKKIKQDGYTKKDSQVINKQNSPLLRSENSPPPSKNDDFTLLYHTLPDLHHDVYSHSTKTLLLSNPPSKIQILSYN